MVGIDQSAHRLAKHQPTEQRNYHLLRAEAEPFGIASLRQASGYTAIGCSTQPLAKAVAIQEAPSRPWCFPILAQLGGTLEMRTNWHLFAEEFGLAADLIGLKGSIDTVSPAAPMTLFERKYQSEARRCGDSVEILQLAKQG